MILIILLLVLIATSYFMLWFNSYFGFFTLEFLGHEVVISFSFLFLLLIGTLILLFMFFKIFDFLFNIKSRYKQLSDYKKSKDGLKTITEGFSAIIAGDLKAAEKFAQLAKTQLGEVPLVKLLLARTAKLSGKDRDASEYYNSLLHDKEAQIIAVKELLFQAKKSGDYAKAIKLAEKALSFSPNNIWAIPILIDLYKTVHDWEKAENIINRGLKNKAITKEKADHLISVINIIVSQEYLKKENIEKSLIFSEKAYKSEQNFIPAVENYVNILLISNKSKKAIKVLENAWKYAPNPAFIATYKKLFDSYEEQLLNLEKLLTLNPFTREGNLFIANLAIENNDYIKAEEHIKLAISLKETYNGCVLMSTLLELEGESVEIIQKWRQKALSAEKDNSWVCNNCEHQDKHWSFNCPSCNTFDSMEWSQPLISGKGSKNTSIKLISDFQSSFLE